MASALVVLSITQTSILRLRVIGLRDEIQGHFQPEFVYQPSEDQVTAFALRDMVPAGLLIGEARVDNTFEVRLDFVIPQYRDFKIGSYVYSSESGLLTGLEPTCVWAEASNSDHAQELLAGRRRRVVVHARLTTLNRQRRPFPSTIEYSAGSIGPARRAGIPDARSSDFVRRGRVASGLSRGHTRRTTSCDVVASSRRGENPWHIEAHRS